MRGQACKQKLNYYFEWFIFGIFSFLLFSSVRINFRNLKYDDGKVLGRSLLVYSTENESRRIAIGLSQDMDLADFHYFN